MIEASFRLAFGVAFFGLSVAFFPDPFGPAFAFVEGFFALVFVFGPVFFGFAFALFPAFFGSFQLIEDHGRPGMIEGRVDPVVGRYVSAGAKRLKCFLVFAQATKQHHPGMGVTLGSRRYSGYSCPDFVPDSAMA